MTELNILAVQNADLLRAIDAREISGVQSINAIADALGRDKSNLHKSLKLLKAEGLVTEDPLKDGLTATGSEQLEAIDRAQGTTDAAGDLPEGLIALVHAQIFPDHQNARRDWDSEEAQAELDALRADIVRNGLLQNLVVRAEPETGMGAVIRVEDDKGERLPLYTLIGGERRWRAIGMAIAGGEWPEDGPILCRLLDADPLETRIAALAENLLRRKLNPIEKATGFQQLADLGLENKDIAGRLGFTPEHVQQHRRFLKLDDADRQRMTLPKDDPRHLSVRDARQKLSAKDAKDAAWKPANESLPIQLLLAELTVSARRRSTYLGGTMPIGTAGLSDPHVIDLATRQLITLPEGPAQYGQDVGHTTIAFANWTVSDACRAAWPDLASEDDERRLAGLRQLQDQAGMTPPDGAIFATPWLNPPFDMTPEGQEIAEKRAADRERAVQAEIERDRRQAADRARIAEVRAKHLAILNQAAEAPPTNLAAATVEAATALERPLPWTLLDNGDVIDANGENIPSIEIWSPDDEDMTFLQMLVLSVNSAAGLPTPPIKSAEAHAAEQSAKAEAAEAEADAADAAEAA